MKKVLVILLAAALCLSFGTAALAAAGDVLVSPMVIAPAPSAQHVSASKTDYAENYYTNWEEGQLPMASVRTVLVDAEGNLWVGTYGSGIAMRPAGSSDFSVFSHSRTPNFTLKNDKIYSMAMDAKGGLWISQIYSEEPDKSAGAAYYYNGELKYYNTEETPGTLNNNFVLLPLVDDNGIVWLGTNDGITRFDPVKNEWKNFTVENCGMPTRGISAMNFDKKGNLWYGTYPEGPGTREEPFYSGFGYISPDGENHVVIDLVSGYDETYESGYLAEIWAKDIECDADGNIWIVCSGSYADRPNKGGVVYVVDPELNISKITGNELLKGKIDPSINSEIRCMEIDEAGTLWFATWNGVFAWNAEGTDNRCFSAATGDWNVDDSTLNIQLDNIYYLDIVGDKMYICSLGGLCIRDFDAWDTPLAKAEYYANGDFAAGQLPFSSTRAVLIDQDGGMWVGTNGGGLAYKPAESEGFTEYSLNGGRLTLGSDVVQSLAMDEKGGIWIAQAKSYVDNSQNKGVAYLYDGIITYFDESTPGTIPNNYVQKIAIDAKGKVWFGSFGGLTCYDPSNGKWVTYSEGLPAPSVDAIAFDSKGGTWFGCYPGGAGTKDAPYYGGFGYIDASGKIVKTWTITADYDETYSTSLLADVWVRDIAVDANDGVWIVCSGSYGQMQNKGGVVYYVDSELNEPLYMTGNGDLLAGKLEGNSEIRCVAIDAEGTVWFGTWNGVYAYSNDKSDDRCIAAAAGSYLAPEEMYTTLDNIYSLDIYGETMYIGSNGGVIVRHIDVKDAADKSQGIYMTVMNELAGTFTVVNGKSVLLDVAPVVKDGTTFVPIRFVAEKLGLTVDYEAATSSVSLKNATTDIKLTLGSTAATVNGAAKTLLAAPFAKDGRTLVPLRFISEALGRTVNYDAATKAITIK